MPEDLDPTTARLAAELASNMLPALTKSLTAAIPSADFAGVFERSSRAAQDLRTQIEKIIRSDIDENRTARSVLLQSISSILEDISALKRTAEKLPANIESAVKAKTMQETEKTGNQDIMGRLEGISAQVEEIIHGLKSFCEAYAHDREQQAQQTPFVSQHIYSGSDAQMEKLLTDSLPGLEGLLRANAKAQSKELEEFSREVAAQLTQNNSALIHEVSVKVSEELGHYGEDMMTRLKDECRSEVERMTKLLKIAVCLSGGCVVMTAVTLIMTLLK